MQYFGTVGCSSINAVNQQNSSILGSRMSQLYVSPIKNTMDTMVFCWKLWLHHGHRHNMSVNKVCGGKLSAWLMNINLLKVRHLKIGTS